MNNRLYVRIVRYSKFGLISLEIRQKKIVGLETENSLYGRMLDIFELGPGRF